MTFSHVCAPDVHYERRFLLFYSIEQHLFVQKQQASRVSHFGTQEKHRQNAKKQRKTARNRLKMAEMARKRVKLTANFQIGAVSANLLVLTWIIHQHE
jgi:hypothetical protein